MNKTWLLEFALVHQINKLLEDGDAIIFGVIK